MMRLRTKTPHHGRGLHQTAVVLTVLLIVLTTLVRAQGGESYDLSWWTVDNGGSAAAAGGDFELGGAIGQPEAALLGGGDYSLSGGFWAVAANPAPPPECARYDLNDDTIIDLDDINLVLFNSIFLQAPYDPKYDFDNNGLIDMSDIFAVVVRFGQPCLH